MTWRKNVIVSAAIDAVVAMSKPGYMSGSFVMLG
jgi:hypothetical protein